MNLATPMTDKIPTRATPSNSPNIIHNVFLYPTVIPNVIAKLMQSPGDRETKNHVGIKINNKDSSGMWELIYVGSHR